MLGKVRHPLNTNDFSSFLLQAQTSKAKVIGLANAGGDTINSIKQAPSSASSRAGRSSRACWCSPATSTRSGLPTAQGLTLTETWYWDVNDANRAWTKRWQAERNAAGKFPTMIHAGVYSGITHYLKAVVALKSAADGKAVVAEMKKLPTDDALFGKGTIDADGRKRPRRLSVRGEEAGGVQVSGRLLQAEGHDPGGRRRSVRSRMAAARWSSG